MQVFGAGGLSNDTPLAFIYSWGRALRFIDGPDEVHLRTIARAEIKKRKESNRSTFAEQKVVRPWLKPR